MSKNLDGLNCKILIDSMDKSTSNIKGCLVLDNPLNKEKTIDSCILDVFVKSDGVKPLLLHSYELDIKEVLKANSNKTIDLNLNGVVLSSLASEILDLDIVLRGTNSKTVLNITRTEYIDYIEDVFKNYGFELYNYAVDVKNKFMSKLFRQYYVYSKDIGGVKKTFKVTYTPYDSYIRMCIYHNNNKTRTNIEYTDIKATCRIEEIVWDILKEHNLV